MCVCVFVYVFDSLPLRMKNFLSTFWQLKMLRDSSQPRYFTSDILNQYSMYLILQNHIFMIHSHFHCVNVIDYCWLLTHSCRSWRINTLSALKCSMRLKRSSRTYGTAVCLQELLDAITLWDFFPWYTNTQLYNSCRASTLGDHKHMYILV